MDHALYTYTPIAQRPRDDHPGTARVHAFVLLCIEHWHALPPEGALRDPRFVGEFGSFVPDWRSWTQREYGLRIGLWRVLDALRACGLQPAVAVNALAVPRLRGLLEELSAHGCEFVGHGLAANTLVHARMPPDEQRRHIDDALAAIARVTGTRPAGWLSQDWGTTPETCALLAAAGLRYTLDWCNDDQAYPMAARHADGRPMVAVPLSAEWDDVQCQWLRNLAPQAHAQLALEAFDRLRGECAAQQRAAVFGLALHPWVCGMSSRIGALRTLLAQLRERPDVNWTTPGSIAARAAQPS